MLTNGMKPFGVYLDLLWNRYLSSLTHFVQVTIHLVIEIQISFHAIKN
jgi:hypothetical protein